MIAQIKAQHIKAIIVEPVHDRKIAERAASATGAKVDSISRSIRGLFRDGFLHQAHGRAHRALGRGAEMRTAINLESGGETPSSRLTNLQSVGSTESLPTSRWIKKIYVGE